MRQYSKTIYRCADCGVEISHQATHCVPCSQKHKRRPPEIIKKRVVGVDPNPSGLCMCGCGQPTKVLRGNRKRGIPFGGHSRFRPGHQAFKHPDAYREEDRGYETPCWIWLGAIDRAGYGKYKAQPAHRVYYERHVGPIPEGLTLDHLCRVTCCVNPAHLEAVTSAENTRRGSTTKLNWGKVRMIREMRNRMSQSELAALMGVGPGAISCVLREVTWKEDT